jgi:broad specificity phosphatase PhoE
VTELLLARHGETDWNLERRVQGHTDRPLNGTGREQARELSLVLASEPLVAVYASDLSRAHETATTVARPHGLEVITEPGLREKHFGTWEGLTDTEIRHRFPDAPRGGWGDGETREQLAARTMAALDGIRARHAAGPILVVSHGGPLRVILEHAGVSRGPIGNCELIRLDY